MKTKSRNIAGVQQHFRRVPHQKGEQEALDLLNLNPQGRQKKKSRRRLPFDLLRPRIRAAVLGGPVRQKKRAKTL